MRRYITRQLVQLVVVVVGISVLAFAILHVIGDPVLLLLPQNAGKEEYERYTKILGLDKPIYVQYWKFASRAVQGDFGKSWYADAPALKLVLERLPPTIYLTFAGLAAALLIALPLGILAALRRHSIVDNLCTALAVAGQAILLRLPRLGRRGGQAQRRGGLLLPRRHRGRRLLLPERRVWVRRPVEQARRAGALRPRPVPGGRGRGQSQRRHDRNPGPGLVQHQDEEPRRVPVAIEPALRIDVADPNTDVDDNGSTLFTAVLGLYFSIRGQWRIAVENQSFQAGGATGISGVRTAFTVNF